MLDAQIRRKLESLTQLPTIPYVISEILNAVDNSNLSAAALGKLIEKDQTLTAKVLSVANSPFYGFSRRISTIELAIVIIGLNSIKEIVLSLAIQRFISDVRKDVFDIRSFWEYSVFCGASSRVIARKLGYRLAGEAFVAGLMHDIGILIIMQFFTKQFLEVKKVQVEKGLTLVEAEKAVLNCTHADIGGWFAQKWNLPEQLLNSIVNHHTSFIDLKLSEEPNESKNSIIESDDSPVADIPQPLTAIVAMTEWFARELGFKTWSDEEESSTLFLASEILEEIKEHDIFNPDSALEIMKNEILEEFQKASIFKEISSKSGSR